MQNQQTYSTPLSHDEHSLIIVSGKHLAKMYEFNNDKMTPQPVVHVEHTIYTDSEGYRGRENSPSSLSGTSSDYEKKDTGEWHDFTMQFKSHIEALSRGKQFDWFYLFAPAEIMPQIKQLLPRDWQEKLRLAHPGNFTKALPHEIETIIKDNLTVNKIDHWTERADEAQAILNNTNASLLTSV